MFSYELRTAARTITIESGFDHLERFCDQTQRDEIQKGAIKAIILKGLFILEGNYSLRYINILFLNFKVLSRHYYSLMGIFFFAALHDLFLDSKINHNVVYNLHHPLPLGNLLLVPSLSLH